MAEDDKSPVVMIQELIVTSLAQTDAHGLSGKISGIDRRL
jgi:hypothetical protein